MAVAALRLKFKTPNPHPITLNSTAYASNGLGLLTISNNIVVRRWRAGTHVLKTMGKEELRIHRINLPS